MSKIQRLCSTAVFVLAGALVGTAAQAQTINITGIVIDSAGSQGIGGATVKLAEYPQITATTAANGSFTLTGITTGVMSPKSGSHSAGEISLNGNQLIINGIQGSTSTSVDIFQSNGSRLLHAEPSPDAHGILHLDNLWKTPGLYYVKITVDGKKYTALSLGTNRISFPMMHAANHGHAKASATYTLQVSAPGYASKSISMSSTTGDAGTIKLAHYQQQTGVWVNVTPSTMQATGVNSDDYGVNGLVTDPKHPNVLYTAVCWQGIWKSTDYGLTWAKVNTGTLGSKIDNGKTWALAIAPDASYLLTCVGNGENGIYKSTDGGVNWTFHAVPYPGTDVYTIAISPYDKNHAVTTSHTSGATGIWESVDAGETWVRNGTTDVGQASYLDFMLSDGVLLATGDGDNGNWGGTLRGVRSGSVWPWTWTWTHVSVQQHFHGSHQAFVDTVNRTVFNPGAFGIFKSADAGNTWTACVEVPASQWTNCVSNCMIGTSKKLYASKSYASITGYGPSLEHADLVPGTSWTNDAAPAGMTNGACRYATTNDGTHNIVVSGNWCAGLWRYIEP